jgi:histidyl-tRNA synthetase
LLQFDFYRRCGIKELSLEINSLGDKQSKAQYRDELVRFLTPKASALSEDSQRRLAENPLRILDSKDPRDVEACKGAPPAAESLSDRSREHFLRVQELLKGAADFVVNPNLVRGFDYYTETLWEVTASGLGSQNAIGGGGRYDNLVENLGGRPTPGVGFGSGIERLLIALESQKVLLKDDRESLVWVIAQAPAAKDSCWNLMRELRAGGIAADMDLSNRSVKAQFKMADREMAKFCLILGENELVGGQVMVKNLKTGEQSGVARRQIVGELRKMIAALIA